MHQKKIKLTIIIALFLFTCFTCINPVHPKEQILQHLGTLIISIILFVDLKKNKLSLFAFSFVAIFILIHVIGARWIYSHVPYNDFFENYFGLNINEAFDLGIRNHYDRLVHFAFGGLFFPFLFESFLHKYKNKVLALLLAWLSLQCFSMLYEVFEWLLAVKMSPEAAERYNGQQGDIFDAQKDMALAMMGSNLLIVYYLFKKEKT